MVKYMCNICNKEFKQKCHFINHTEKKKYPCNLIYTQISPKIINEKKAYNLINNIIINKPCEILQNPAKNNKYTCKFCEKTFTRIDNFKVHLNFRCKIKKEENNKIQEENNKIKEQNNKIENLIKEIELLKQNKINSNNDNVNNNIKKELETIKDKINENYPITNQLINIIVDKHNKISELNDQIQNTSTNSDNNVKIKNEKDDELKRKNQKIKILENMVIKRQKGTEYPHKNVVYMLTTEDNKKKRIYIIGKAKILKKRLSTYNKTSEHEVVYYKECKNEKQMGLAECIVLELLDKYREVANRDRFVLPVESDISLFTGVIDKAIKTFN